MSSSHLLPLFTHRKQSFSATSCARCVADSLRIRHTSTTRACLCNIGRATIYFPGWSSGLGGVEKVDPLGAAEVKRNLLLVLNSLSSTFALLPPETLSRSMACAYCLRQSFKSMKVGRNMSFPNVCMDHCS